MGQPRVDGGGDLLFQVGRALLDGHGSSACG
jgi:hypothetical protein